MGRWKDLGMCWDLGKVMWPVWRGVGSAERELDNAQPRLYRAQAKRTGL